MLCRLCVSKCNDFTYIFENEQSKNNISTLINLYFTFQVSHDDGKSNVICRQCLDNIQNFDSFCKSVENAQNNWNALLSNQSSKQESDPENDNSYDICDEAQVKTEINDAINNEEESVSDMNENTNDDLDYEDKLKTECLEIPLKNRKSSRQSKPETNKSKRSLVSEQFDRLIAEHSNLLCNECTEPMKNFRELKKHFKLVHKKPGFMQCCKRKFFNAADLSDHINLHLNPDYFKCHQCDKRFSSRYSLDFHNKHFHPGEKEKGTFQCKHCSRKFVLSCFRDKHEQNHETKEDTEVGDEKTYFCELCGKSYPNKKKLKTHTSNVHKINYNRMCHLCGKTVRGDKALERHQLQHAGIKPMVKCHVCNAELSTKGILKAHMIALHPEDTNVKYDCEICGKKSPSQRALKNHMDYVHKCERTHKCSLCEKSFKKPQELTEHIAKHTGDRLYECPHCDKTFKVRSNMHHHRKLKHPKEFEENRGRRITKPK